MKEVWTRYSARIDDTTLRERVLIFITAAVAVVALLHSVLTGPLLDRQRLLSRQMARTQADTKAIQDELQKIALARGVDPDTAGRRRLGDIKAQLSEIEQQLQVMQSRLVPPEKIASLLEEFLAKHQKLELVDLKTVAPSPALPGGAAAKAEEKKPGAERQIYRHGVEMTVKGSYLDLLQYLTQLERMPLQLYWSRVELSATEYPVITLKVAVYTLSFDKAWLVV